MSIIEIDADFDGGNIEVIEAADADNIRLKIPSDTKSDYRQSFYFRARASSVGVCRFVIENAGDATYPEAWPGASVVVSYDGEDWFRRPASYNGQQLTFEINPQHDEFYIALFPPYSYRRHLDLVTKTLAQSHFGLYRQGQSVEGRSIDILQFGGGDPKLPAIWIIARQHPAETMAEWYMEGVLERLSQEADGVVGKLLQSARLYIVANMNPDGGVAGNIRANAAGVDLNRAWSQPDKDRSPEVAFVRSVMEETGVDLFLDIHGDEELCYVFPAGCEGNPGYCDRIAGLQQAFYHEYQTANSEFQWIHGYPKDEPGKADPSIACNYVGQIFDCLSLTIEMPFKDNANAPDRHTGWSIQRSRDLGSAVLEPIVKLLSELR